MHMLRIVGEAHAADVRDTVVLAMNMELIQVSIAPAHRDLNRVVQISHGAVATDEEAPPDPRANPTEPHLQLVNDGWLGEL